MATQLRTLGRTLLTRIDHWYGHKYQLRPLGPVLLLGCEPYRGEPRKFADGTRLLPQQRIGVLHFNNQQIASLGVDTRHHAGVRFARLFRQSLHALAEHVQSDPALHDVSVYQGLTWFRAHGHKVGFVSEAIPTGVQHWLLTMYFRILTWGFSPVGKRHGDQHEPRRFWITRNDLIKHFGVDEAGV
jgi:hypothetical protein